MKEYITWDFSCPGISFNLISGRICIFKTTLTAMGYPEYYRFLFSQDDLMFGIEPCGIDDGGANRLREEKISSDHYTVSSKELVRFVFQTCGWEKKKTYRVQGTQDGRAVYFDLRKAYEIREGRMIVHNI